MYIDPKHLRGAARFDLRTFKPYPHLPPKSPVYNARKPR
tara:strand:- start:33913 stop:34029 length:117 start_codon:yes stop_codon:yes gene_type:complete